MSQCPLDYESVLYKGHRPTGVILAEQRLHRLRAHLWTNDMVARFCRVLNMTLWEFCTCIAGESNPKVIRSNWNRDDYWPLVMGKQFTEGWNAFMVLKHEVNEDDPLYDPIFYSERARHNK